MTILDVVWGIFLGGWCISLIFWILEVRKNPERSWKYLISMAICATLMNLIVLIKNLS